MYFIVQYNEKIKKYSNIYRQFSYFYMIVYQCSVWVQIKCLYKHFLGVDFLSKLLKRKKKEK